jgi:DNA polymerase III delta prime subunit
MITVNLNKAKAIAHEMRRASRAEEFKPHDEVIAKRIPGIAEAEAEAARAAIRAKYAVVQEAIDQAQTPDEIKKILLP